MPVATGTGDSGHIHCKLWERGGERGAVLFVPRGWARGDGDDTYSTWTGSPTPRGQGKLLTSQVSQHHQETG